MWPCCTQFVISAGIVAPLVFGAEARVWWASALKMPCVAGVTAPVRMEPSCHIWLPPTGPKVSPVSWWQRFSDWNPATVQRHSIRVHSRVNCLCRVFGKPPFGCENLRFVQFMLLFLDPPQNSSEHLSVYQTELMLTPQSCLCRCPAEAEEGERKDILRSGRSELPEGWMSGWSVCLRVCPDHPVTLRKTNLQSSV